jgi:two-component system, LuxR family, response regulator FixJ
VTLLEFVEIIHGSTHKSPVNTSEYVAMTPTLYIVDRPGQGLGLGLQDAANYVTESYLSGAAFLEAVPIARPACMVLELQLPDMSGVELLEKIRQQSDVPVIMVAEQWEMASVMRCMRLGIFDLCSKPTDVLALRKQVRQAVAQDAQLTGVRNRVAEARRKLARLTERQRELMTLFAKGLSQKEIAAVLDLSPRTVEKHRARLNQRLGTHRLSDYFHLNLLAASELVPTDGDPTPMTMAQIQMILGSQRDRGPLETGNSLSRMTS